MTRRLLAIAATLLAPLLLPPTAGGPQGGRPDYEIARDAVERGEILPLTQLLDILQKAHPGRVVEIDLEFRDGRLSYEVEIVTVDGRLIEVLVDAADGSILEYDEDDDDDD